MVTNLLCSPIVTRLMMLARRSNVDISLVILVTRGVAHMCLVE